MQDFRLALRHLLKNPGFTAVAVLTLALGIGANTAIFSVLHAVLLRPLPYQNPDRLVTVCERNTKRGFNQIIVTAANFFAWREQAKVFDGLAAEVFESYNVGTDTTPFHVQAAVVTANYFSVLGAHFQLGRGFVEGEDEKGRHQVAVITHGIWQRQFGGRADILGQRITVNGQSVTIVGVLDPEFRTFNPRAVSGRPAMHFEPQLWTPYPFTPEERQARWHFFVGIGRLKDGVTLAAAQAEMDRVAAALAQSRPENRDWGAAVEALPYQVLGESRPALMVLMGAAGFVLLIACANVSNLFLARDANRSREFAIRVAVGAGRWNLIRPAICESLILALAGGFLALLLANWILAALPSLAPPEMPRIDSIRLNLPVLTFSTFVSLLIGLIAGLIPALQILRTDPQEVLQSGSHGATPGSAVLRWRSALVVIQVATATALLAGTGLFVRSFQRLEAVYPGFDRENVLAIDLSIPSPEYGEELTEPAKRIALIAGLLQRVSALPGVESAATVHGLPFGTFVEANVRMTVEGEAVPAGDMPRLASYRQASPGYFKTMRIPLLHGREFTWTDDAKAPSVAVVNETFAKRFFGQSNPIGRRINAGLMETNFAEIIGVVADVKVTGLDAPAHPEFYASQLQRCLWMVSLVVRTSIEPGALVKPIERELLALDKNLPAYNMRTLEQAVAGSIASKRFTAFLIAAFGFVALALALVGIFGVLSSSIAQRRRELSIRIALGAQHRNIIQQVLGEGLGQVVVGTVLGLGASLILIRLVSTQLYMTNPAEPATYAGVLILMMITAVAACLVPALRATQADPIEALRSE